MFKKKQKVISDPYLLREAEKYETPIPSREFIQTELGRIKKAVKRRQLEQLFQLQDPSLQEALRRRLKAMVRDGQLLRTPKGYLPITQSEIHEGVFFATRDGEGVVVDKNNQKIQLNTYGLRGFYDGDLIQVQVIHIDEEGNRRGRILELIKAAQVKAVGRLVQGQINFEVIPFERKFIRNIAIPKAHIANAKEGDIVQVEINREEKYRLHPEPVGAVIAVLGDVATPGIEIQTAIRKFGLPEQWPKAVEKEIKKFSQEDFPLEEGREDICHLPLVTIDGEDAKDFDDAVYCEQQKRGWQLWVAIADVSYYVKPGMALDQEALSRGNSTYFPGTVIPMLPEVLSNGLCSLKPHVYRYCVVCHMTISAKGLVTRPRFFRARMRSHARLTYTEVAKIFDGHENLSEKYQTLLPSLQSLLACYQALHAQRKKRGAIDFDSIENRILFDKQGKIKNIVPYERNVAHRVIEECMLAANVCAANFIEKNKQATLYRVHDKPPKEKITALRQFLAELRLDLPGRQNPSAKHYSKLLDSIKERGDKHLIETVMLRSLSQAIYSVKNIGHFGLAYESYVHFTSPIRRYPDLIVHRTITDLLQGKKIKKSVNIDALEKLGISCSQSERRSDEATRDATMALKCHYMQDKIGEHYLGVISGVTGFGIFVELKEIYVEGLVHVTSLGNEYFVFDAAHHRMVGERTRTVYRLGDNVEVIVSRVDLDTKRIDLELVNSEPKKTKNKTKRGKKSYHQESIDKDGKKKSTTRSRNHTSRNKGKRHS